MEAFRAAQRDEKFSYAEVGASERGAPAGYNLDHNRVRLGSGDADFSAACAALRAWRMFPAPWTSITPNTEPIAVGKVVAMQARALGLWWLNACRIVYVIDETTPAAKPLERGNPPNESERERVVRRFGFAYGTLPAHVEQGEERFSVEQLADGSVWYDLRAFSRPRFWPVRLAKPVARALQRRFVRESLAAMQRAVRGGVSTNA
ncbi:MAG TPA: DUF1990 domain-containing protein [Opitutaceae bacterium]|nr:DUF1990 domain-containing protein [Opitutaceae bacterium]